MGELHAAKLRVLFQLFLDNIIQILPCFLKQLNLLGHSGEIPEVQHHAQRENLRLAPH